jgi:hypothetical protein
MKNQPWKQAIYRKRRDWNFFGLHSSPEEVCDNSNIQKHRPFPTSIRKQLQHVPEITYQLKMPDTTVLSSLNIPHYEAVINEHC